MKPSRAVATIANADCGKGVVESKAMANAVVPDPKPLTITISIGDFAERFRVQLFSRPQQAQAASTSNEPGDICQVAASAKSTHTKMLARVMIPSDSYMRLPTAS